MAKKLAKWLYDLRIKGQHWLIFRLGGVPQEWYGNKEAWQRASIEVLSKQTAVFRDEIKAQRDRIEACILRETFGDRDFLGRQQELKYAITAAAKQAVEEAIHDGFYEFFENLALYETERVDGRTLLLSRTEDER